MSEKDSQVRATAYRHAQSFEEKKAIRNRVADLVVELFDIPADAKADPAYPQQPDAALFKHSLSLFQPSDFDDLVRERNIDNRCGYALCAKPNVKVRGGQTVWNGKGGKQFSLVSKEELEKWCSERCGDRASFVRVQLHQEPAWNREMSNIDIKLLDEVQRAQENNTKEAAEAKSLADAFQNTSLDSANSLTKDELAVRLQGLFLKQEELKKIGGEVTLLEKSKTAAPEPPGLHIGSDMIEGYRPKKVRFASSNLASSDEGMSDIDSVHDHPDM